MNETSPLFSPIHIGTTPVPNRFVRSATHDFMAAEDGSVTDRQVALHSRLAEGEVGIIITGHAYVQPSGKASPRQIAVFDDRFIDGLARIADAVHLTPSRVFLQIAHAGRQTKSKLCGCVPVSPSPVYDPVSKIMPRELTAGDIEILVQDFISAGVRAARAGFDGVQLHAAHGYLLSSFISPHANRRQDEWGGSREKRSRILVEILRGIKTLCGKAFPVIVKLNSTDFLEGGLSLEEAVWIARFLEAEGIDGIEVSGGMVESGRGSVWPGLRRESEEGYFVDNAARIKEAVSIPLFALGGIRTLAVAERIVKDDRADLISLSRPLIRDPDLVKNFRKGRATMSDCISCNKCFNPRGIRCAELS